MRGWPRWAVVPGMLAGVVWATGLTAQAAPADDQYRRRGLLAVFLGPRIVSFTMDPQGDEPLETTRPKLEGLAKLVVPRVK